MLWIQLSFAANDLSLFLQIYMVDADSRSVQINDVCLFSWVVIIAAFTIEQFFLKPELDLGR